MYDELKGKKLLVLGGMRISCEIVRKARKMGVFVAVTDYNPPEQSPAKLIADEYFSISATDVNAVVDLIKKEKFDGVLTGFVDLLLPYYAKICNKAAIPSLALEEQYKTFIEKRKYKALLRKYEVPTPEEYMINNISAEEIAVIKYPLIIKPADSSGARGVQICKGKKEFKSAYEVALQNSKTNSVIIEEFLKGEEVTAFWHMEDGEPYFIGLGNRHVEKNQGENIIALPVGYTFPSIYTKKYIDEIVPRMERMLRGSKIRNGFLFLQCIVDDGVPKIYDLGLRLTGSLEYHIFDRTCGFNPMEKLIRFALLGNQGASIKNKVDPFLNEKYGWNISFLMKPGVIARIIGHDEVKRLPDVIDIVIAHDIGEQVKLEERGLLKQICCRVLGCSNTLDEMKEAVNKVTSTFNVLDANGESLLLPTLDIDKYIDTIA